MRYRIRDTGNWQTDIQSMIGHLKQGDSVELPHEEAYNFLVRQLGVRDMLDYRLALRVGDRRYTTEPGARQQPQLRRVHSEPAYVVQLRERIRALEAEHEQHEIALQRMQLTASSVVAERDALQLKLDAREASLQAERAEVDRLRISRDKAREQRDAKHVEVEQLKQAAAAARPQGALSDRQRDELQRLRVYARKLERATLRLVSLLGAVRPQQSSPA